MIQCPTVRKPRVRLQRLRRLRLWRVASNKEVHKSDSSGFGYGQPGGYWYHFLVKFQILESLSRGKDLRTSHTGICLFRIKYISKSGGGS